MALRPHTSNESDYETLMQRLHISGNSSNGSNSVTSNIDSPVLNDGSRQRSQRSQGQQQLGEEYRMYERSNIIAASKYATPKQIEQLHLQQQQHHSSRLTAEIPLNGSGGAVGNEHYEITCAKRQSPVYENLDFYHNVSPVTGNHLKQFDSTTKRAQPQSPASINQQTGLQRGHYMVMQSQLPHHATSLSGRYAHTPVPDPDSTPIYENMRVIPNSGQRAQPQASPASATIYQLHNIDVLSSPQHHNTTPRALQQAQQKSQTAISEHSTNLTANTPNIDLLASPMHRRSTSNSSLKSSTSTAAVGGGLPSVVEPNSPTQRYRNLSLPTHMNNTPVSPSKSYASSVSNPNDYKLHQHTPIKTMVSKHKVKLCQIKTLKTHL